MEITSQPTLFSWLVFVVWRTIEQAGKQAWKDRMVADIRGLNKITVTDFYPP